MSKKKSVAGEQPAVRPKKDFRDAYLNAGFYDGDGTFWTEDSFTLASGEGDTFGPNHPRRPAKLEEAKTRNHTAQASKRP